jgi:hypothetical protein
MIELIVLGCSAFFGCFVSATVSAHFLNRSNKVERKEDLQRQDKVADLLAEVNENTNSKLDTIHVLVNSNMTAAMQAELDATIRELAMMKEVISLNRAAGRSPAVEAISALDMTQAKISELKSQLADRARQTRVAELKADS